MAAQPSRLIFPQVNTNSKASIERITIGSIVLLGLYCASYLLLSLTGGYELGKSGRFTRFNLPTHDIYIWELRFGRDSHYLGDPTLIPLIYKPLLALDRKYWHKTLPMLELDDEGNVVDSPSPDPSLMHPRVHQAGEIFEAFAKRREEENLEPGTEEFERAWDEMMESLEEVD